MFSRVYSGGVTGIEGYIVGVEADISDGLPAFSMVGYLSAQVREAQDRVKSALRNSGYRLSPKKITVNLSPANIRKEGTGFDLPVAVAILAAFEILDRRLLEDCLIVGELSLKGEIRPVNGTLSIVQAAKKAGLKRCFLPKENIREGMLIEAIELIGVSSISELIKILNNEADAKKVYTYQYNEISASSGLNIDYSDVNGQLLLKRAAEIAVCGKHNLLMVGPPGTGKSMIARRIPTIMPPLSKEERIEVLKVYSISGLINESSSLIEERPFRNPHHTITPQALIGGGRIPRPGEASLAAGGVLFLDELSEFDKRTIEALREPLEEKTIRISRMLEKCEFPANFLLVAAMNPCECGHYPDLNKCSCTYGQIKHYWNKISMPIIDRMDIFVTAAPISYDELRAETKNETSEVIRNRVERVWEIQSERFKDSDIHFNGDMRENEVSKYCVLKKKDETFLKSIFEDMGLNARSYYKILKISRTIADMDGYEHIEQKHLSEAVSYKNSVERNRKIYSE